MKFSVSLFPIDRWGGTDGMLMAMKRADELGFGSVTLPEHLMNPLVGDPPQRLVFSSYFHDLFVVATAIAMVTKNLRLHLSALVLPYRHPLLAAKMIASLDQFSKGRARITIGAGWLESEFEALGVDFHQRSAMTGEYVEAMIALWTQAEPEFSGKFVQIPKCEVEPKCWRKPHATLLGGGSGPLALRRVLKYYSGWAPMQSTPEQMRPALAWLEDNAEAHGRNFADFEFWTRVNVLGGDPAVTAASAHGAPYIIEKTQSHDLKRAAEELAETAAAYRALGNFEELALTFPWRTPEEYVERLEWLAGDVLPMIG